MLAVHAASSLFPKGGVMDHSLGEPQLTKSEGAAATPATYGEGLSAFLTPSSSSGRPVSFSRPRFPSTIPHLDLSQTPSPASSFGMPVSFPRSTFPSLIPYSYLSPTPSPARVSLSTSREVVDILGELFLYGPLEMAQYILSFLTPEDLFRCLFVCKDWNALILQDKSHMQVIAAHRKNRKRRHSKEAVSLFTPNPLPGPPTRLALSSIRTNLQQLTQRDPSSFSFTTSSLPPTMKLRPCPNCASPAKELNLRRAECTKCMFDFCKKCFRHYHEGDCKSRQDLWGEDHEDGPSSIHIAGKSKSESVRKRLRRL